MPRSSPQRNAKISAAIVAHFRLSHRDLPWRRSVDPYGIWVSEIMLQQTRVATVIPYYERWMAAFPTLAALADADLGEVLAHWTGLGYYSRARNLHRGAREALERFGEVPREPAALESLPGVGRYTAGAIASIAFGARAPIVDGNVARVLARLDGITVPIRSTEAQRTLWARAAELVPAAAPSAFNQGLMELGALVCTPRAPRCGECPVARHCVALATDRVGELPVMPPRKAANALPLIDEIAVLIARAGRLAVARRKDSGLFGGLWEFPAAASPESLHDSLLGLREVSAHELTRHDHLLTHRRLRTRLHRGAADGRLSLRSHTRYQELAWKTPMELRALGLSTTTKTLLASCEENPTWTRSRLSSTGSTKPSRRSSKASPSSATTSKTTTSRTRPGARPRASTS